MIFKNRYVYALLLILAINSSAHAITTDTTFLARRKFETLNRHIDDLLRRVRLLFFLCDADSDWSTGKDSEACQLYQERYELLKKLLKEKEELKERYGKDLDASKWTSEI